jgi:hypothetical protein
MSQVIAIVGVALVCLGGAALSPARALEPTCLSLAKLDVAREDEVVSWAGRVAEAVIGAEARVTPSTSRPRVVFLLHPVEISPGAWYCPAGDAIYVSRELALWAWQGRASDGADFLAFVVAHELAHRRFDASGQVTSALAQAHSLSARGRSCPTAAEALTESSADHRAVFLVGLARNPFDGRDFSPFNLTRRDGIRAFLAQELGWPLDCPSLDARVAAVVAATSRMRELGALYEAALLLAMAPTDGVGGARSLSMRALARLGTLTRGPGWDAVPEIDLLRAVQHVDRAQRAGWCPTFLASAGLRPDPCELRCAPVFPRFAGLSPYDVIGSRTGESATRAEELAKARDLLAGAKKAGLRPEHALGVEACIAFADAKPTEGLAAFRALSSARRGAWQPTIALLELQRRLLEAEDPAHEFAGNNLMRAPAPLRVPEAPLAGGPALAHPRATPCGAFSDYDLGEGWRMRSAPTCWQIVGQDGRGLELTERTAVGALEAWRFACDVRGPGLADDGTAIYGARCAGHDVSPDDGWILFEGGRGLNRVVRVRNL